MILIIDDRIEEKIGNFVYTLETEGLDYKVATTLEEAEQLWEEYGRKKNEIDAIILDYIFPKNATDNTEYTNDVPNGIKFLLDNEFMMHNKMISLIINTSADKDIIEKALKMTKYFNNIRDDVLYVCQEKHPLLEANAYTRSVIISGIKEGIKRREISKRIAENGATKTTSERWKGTNINRPYYLDYNGD